jgi:predicted DNA-binding transcriptional regulator AlpA
VVPVPALLTGVQVQQILGVSRHELQNLVRGGFPEPIRIGPHRTKWVARHVDEWIREYDYQVPMAAYAGRRLASNPGVPSHRTLAIRIPGDSEPAS